MGRRKGWRRRVRTPRATITRELHCVRAPNATIPRKLTGFALPGPRSLVNYAASALPGPRSTVNSLVPLSQRQDRPIIVRSSVMVRGALDPWGGVASNGQRRRLNGPHIFAADVCHSGRPGRAPTMHLFELPKLQDDPRGPQDRPNTAQEAPKRAPRRPERAPRRPKRRPRRPQEESKRANTNRKSEPSTPRGPQETPRKIEELRKNCSTTSRSTVA